MGLKFEYTQTPLSEHWDADHLATFVEDPSIDTHLSFEVCDRTRTAPRSILLPQFGNSTVTGFRTTVPLPPWEEDLKDRLIPIVSLAFTTAILEAIKTGSTVLIITVPAWISLAALIIVLGDIARRRIWNDHPESKLLNIRLLCPNQEVHDGLAAYFQGTWEL